MSEHLSHRRDRGRLAAERALVWPIADRVEWFADEVAIDFPSIRAVIDRMRDAFLAPDQPPCPLSAELLLTPWEAFDGAVIPLDVPVRRMCRACGGRGEIWAEPCGACAGCGDALVTYPVQLVVPPRVTEGARFRLSVSAPSAPRTRVEVRVAIR